MLKPLGCNRRPYKPRHVRRGLALFALGCSLYIVISDWLLSRYVPAGHRELAGTLKALGFVAIAGSIAWLFVVRQERVLREERRRSIAAEMHLELALGAAQQGLWSWEVVTGRITCVPDLALQLGYPAETLESLNAWSTICHPEDQQGIASIMSASAGTADNPIETTLRLRTCAGDYVVILLRGRAVHDEAGRLERIVGVFIDITGRRRAELALEESRRELRALSVHLERAREQERIHIARELHDELGQALAVVQLDLEFLSQVAGDLSTAAREKLSQVMLRVDACAGALRRIAADLRPAVLDDLGLTAAAEWLTREAASHSGIDVRFETSCEEDVLPHAAATHLYRILQEALNNAVRHAGAHRIVVRLECTREEVNLSVLDDGVGIAASAVDDGAHFGIVGMRERAEALGGHLALTSATNGGTRLEVAVPRSAGCDEGQRA